MAPPSTMLIRSSVYHGRAIPFWIWKWFRRIPTAPAAAAQSAARFLQHLKP